MSDYINPRGIIETEHLKPGHVSWTSPSNLAIVKYWGKYGVQMPRNPSISFTLGASYTETTLAYRQKEHPGNPIALDFFFEEQPNPAFREKVLKFLESITPIFPFLRQLHLEIRTRNSFPHSAGIASSASAMSALALCLCSLEKKLLGTLDDENDFYQKASFVARLGSGSACRSVYPYMALWGEYGEAAGSSNDFAIPFESHIHPVFKTFQNAILIVSRAEKSVSSRAGHSLMEGNVYAESRYQQARQRMHQLLHALRNGEVDAFGQIAEDEALTLHALMMTSSPSFLLMRPNSLQIIERVRAFRKESGLPLYFSLDAGPNLHLLYPEASEGKILPFIRQELIPFCENGEWIADRVGKGPQKK